MESIQEILAIVAEIVEKSADGGYIFRGEPQCYPRVSSGLFRDYDIEDTEDIDVVFPLAFNERFSEYGYGDKTSEDYYTQEYWQRQSRGVNFNIIQDKIVNDAKGYDRADLSTLQHFGASTNLIDFSENLNVALYCASDGSYDQSGRVILLQKEIPDYRIFSEDGDVGFRIFGNEGKGYRREWLTLNWREWVWKPKTPEERIDAQKSVFVQSARGFVKPDAEVIIPAHLKKPMRLYLSNCYSMSDTEIYGDVHGYIKKSYDKKPGAWSSRDSYKELALGSKAQNAGNNEKAICHYNKAIAYFPDEYKNKVERFNLGFIYYRRAQAYADIPDWNRALRDVWDFVMHHFYWCDELFFNMNPRDKSPYKILVDYNHHVSLFPEVANFIQEVSQKRS